MKKIILLLLPVFFLYPFYILAADLPAQADRVEINTASLQQLKTLVNIGDVRAQAIINDRPFSSVGDLSRVKGIGDGTRLQKIKDQGLAYVSGQINEVTGSPLVNENNFVVNDTASDKTAVAGHQDALSEPAEVIPYPTGVFINEIMPNPEGPDETEEWFEIKNSNNFDVDLYGWKVKDIAGTISIFTFTKNTKILANGFLVLKRPETKMMLNNDEDGLNLLSPDGNTVDAVSFTKAPLGQSYNKTNSGWAWGLVLTPGATNIVNTTSAGALPKTKISDNNKIKIAVAGLSLPAQTDTNQDILASNPWFLFFTALAITIISAVAVLLIKFKLKGLGKAST
jgi:hypothetical protein